MKKQIVCSKIDIRHRSGKVPDVTLLAGNISYRSGISGENAGSLLTEEVTLAIAPDKIPETLRQNLRFFILTLYTADNQTFTAGTETYPAVCTLSASKSGGQIKFTVNRPL
jgi:hypothetical protein